LETGVQAEFYLQHTTHAMEELSDTPTSLGVWAMVTNIPTEIRPTLVMVMIRPTKSDSLLRMAMKIYDN